MIPGGWPRRPCPVSNERYARSDATGTSEAHGSHHKTPKNRKELTWLSLGALGVVYGDIAPRRSTR